MAHLTCCPSHRGGVDSGGVILHRLWISQSFHIVTPWDVPAIHLYPTDDMFVSDITYFWVTKLRSYPCLLINGGSESTGSELPCGQPTGFGRPDDQQFQVCRVSRWEHLPLNNPPPSCSPRSCSEPAGSPSCQFAHRLRELECLSDKRFCSESDTRTHGPRAPTKTLTRALRFHVTHSGRVCR